MNPYNSHRRSNQHLQLEDMNDENSFDDEDEDSKWSEQYNSRQRNQNLPVENGCPDVKMKETGRFEHLQLDHKDSESVLNQYKNP